MCLVIDSLGGEASESKYRVLAMVEEQEGKSGDLSFIPDCQKLHCCCSLKTCLWLFQQ